MSKEKEWHIVIRLIGTELAIRDFSAEGLETKQDVYKYFISNADENGWLMLESHLFNINNISYLYVK